MGVVHFPSLDEAEIVDIEFVRLNGSLRSLRLLVDSGFTGASSFVLPLASADLVRAAVPAAQTTGALQGTKDRGWVMCQIKELNFRATLIAIITDTTPLSLPTDVHGLAGLAFLRQFASWGSQHTANGWQFSLSDDRK